jgi:riboflavin synthase
MFTGITQGLFPVTAMSKHDEIMHYQVTLNAVLVKDLAIGASVAVDGVCQTVVAINNFDVSFDAIPETLAKTTLNDLFINRKLSIERSVCYGQELGGHVLSGHIFEIGKITGKKSLGDSLVLTIQCSQHCFAFVQSKGFIAIDGSSLTIGKINTKQCSFEVYLIPETLRVTNFIKKAVGSSVNIEPDMNTMILVTTAQSYFANIEERLTKLENLLLNKDNKK